MSERHVVKPSDYSATATAGNPSRKTTVADLIRDSEKSCECESAKCDHENACNRTPSQNVATKYGTFKMCQTCAYRMPEEFLKH